MALNAVKRFRLRELTAVSRIPLSQPSPSSSASPAPAPTARINPFVPHKNPETGRWAPPKYSLRRQADLVKQARASGTLHLLPPGPKFQLTPAPVSVPARKTKKNTSSAATSSEPSSKDEPASTLVARPAPVPAVKPSPEPISSMQSTDAAVLSEDAQWDLPIEWEGNVRTRNVVGADTGARLYAGKKRMFKGHKWERVRVHKVRRTQVMVRDMKKRVLRFKRWHARGKPNPLKPAPAMSKAQKLPF